MTGGGDIPNLVQRVLVMLEHVLVLLRKQLQLFWVQLLFYRF